jgi:hypothetical protein
MTGHGGLIRIQALGVGSAVLSPDAALVVPPAMAAAAAAGVPGVGLVSIWV